MTPDFQVTTGQRRISSTQRNLLKRFDIDTPAEEDVRKWNTFWDAPLVVPGGHDTTDLPRKADEIQRASVSYKSQSCHVTSNGARVSVTFDGLTLGLFSGDIEFTAYKGSNLLRQEAIAKTDQLISRDRAGAYAEPAEKGAPGEQVSDRVKAGRILASQAHPQLDRYVSTVTIAASIIAAVRVAKLADIDLSIGKVITTVQQSVRLAVLPIPPCGNG